MSTYPWDSQISVVEGDSFNLNQHIMLAELGKSNIVFQNKAIESVVDDLADGPSS